MKQEKISGIKFIFKVLFKCLLFIKELAQMRAQGTITEQIIYAADKATKKHVKNVK